MAIPVCLMQRARKKMRRRLLALTLGSRMAAVYAPRAQQPQLAADTRAVAGDIPALRPTNHPRLPSDIAQLWLAPPATGAARARGHSPAMLAFAEAVKLEVEANYAKALPMFSEPALRQGPLGDYAIYYTGLAELRLGHAADARRAFQGLQARAPVGYLTEAAALREAECDESLGNLGGAIEIYDRLARAKTTAPDDVLMRLGRAARSSGDADKAATAFARVYYEFPLSDLSALAGSELEGLPNVQPIAPGSGRYKFELGRAERLFGSKRYAQARTAFEGLRNAAEGDDRELINLRLAECDYFLKLYEKFPTGRYAERAAWKIGWWAYKNGRHGDTIRVFEKAAVDFPRSDYRPAWLYWSGRAHDAMKNKTLADARYTLAATDYL